MSDKGQIHFVRNFMQVASNTAAVAGHVFNINANSSTVIVGGDGEPRRVQISPR